MTSDLELLCCKSSYRNYIRRTSIPEFHSKLYGKRWYWTTQSSYDFLPRQRCQNAKRRNCFSHFNMFKKYYCTIYIWKNQEYCWLFIDVLNSKTRTYDLLPLRRRQTKKHFRLRKNNEAVKTSDPIQSNPIHGWIQTMSWHISVSVNCSLEGAFTTQKRWIHEV